ncbi:glycosyltransferase [Butyrivibrio sp. AC2005]|uniref:glycosyltransferase n=1 Tax=Butyrivibrio sp. AC2005 TaxID=1280672 RepID=UPI000411F77B|nr:glycosyltransferase [Butyrivibrio sp. AC2005]
MNRVTVVCCYNDLQQFEDLKNALEKQSEKAELLGIDNRASAFSSCAAAYNSIVKDITTPYVLYSHQDIIFEDENNIKQLGDYIEKTGTDDIVGVAGVRVSPKITYTNIFDGLNEKKPAGKLRVEGLEECDTVDECIFGGHSEYFKKEPFDEEICNNWHLYAVEQCLRTKLKGNKVWVCDVVLYHHSDGEHNYKLHENFRELSKAYHDRLDYIVTPCCRGYTDVFRRNWGFIKRNRKIGIYSNSRIFNGFAKLVDKLGQKNRIIHRCLYGKRFFK